MKYTIINDRKYDLIENHKNGFDIDAVSSKLTEYFYYFDYIIGDWSYGKLRLKGFCNSRNVNYRDINDFSRKSEYIEKNCAYDCKYFILKNLEVINEAF